MYRLAEDVAKKILRNVKMPDIGPMEITEKDPFKLKSTKSIGFVDCYAAVGTEFDYTIELSYSFINPVLPSIETIDGYFLYRKAELISPTESFNVPRYLADPNIDNCEDLLDVTDCSVVVASDIEKLSATLIPNFETLVKLEPMLLDCLQENLK